MKKDFIKLSKIIVLGVLLSAGITFAANWTPPSTSFPGNNTPAPVNVGRDAQIKSGQLSVGGDPDIPIPGGNTIFPIVSEAFDFNFNFRSYHALFKNAYI